jgi:hypothetical protein
MDLATRLLWFSILLGIVVSAYITIQHTSGGTHPAYDNWLLPVFLAIALQLRNG